MFHLRDGFFFERLADGAVRIRYARPVILADGSPDVQRSAIIAQTTVPENEWASVIASVCAKGETAETWQTARDYHATGAAFARRPFDPGSFDEAVKAVQAPLPEHRADPK